VPSPERSARSDTRRGTGFLHDQDGLIGSIPFADPAHVNAHARLLQMNGPFPHIRVNVL